MSDATFEKTLTLGDAIRLSGPMAFNIMIKPAGSLCNLDCKYCYYLDKAEIYGGKEPRMTEAMLEKVVQEYISANGVPEVTFNWHGGEPLVLGLDFYRKALEFEKKYACEKVIHNTIQTNAPQPGMGEVLPREQFPCGNIPGRPQGYSRQVPQGQGRLPDFRQGDERTEYSERGRS